MKEFYIGSYPCYEFSNIELAEKILPLLQNIVYVPIGSNDFRTELQSSAGYLLDDTGNLQSFYDKELYNWFQECIDIVCKKHIKIFDLDISDLWVTKTGFSQASTFHSHSLSVFSGLFYLQDCKNSDTVFQIPDTFLLKWKDFLDENNIIKHPKYFHSKAEKGKLIIWPSELPHMISRHTEKFTRHTVAFNTMFVGENKHPAARIVFSKRAK